MGRFSGKSLLVLGSNNGAVDIVEYAKENGAYTIVADYYPPERSAAKRVADEHVLVSTTDLNALSAIVEEKHIDGILAGIGEINIVCACKLSEKHHLPFHFTMDQWNLIQKKDEFRGLCEKFSVSSPKTYFTGTEISESAFSQITYPVVVKPVDACNSRGVHICENYEELCLAESDARNNSKSGTIIVEAFCRGEEFTAHYSIVRGKAALMCIDNRYPVAIHEGNVTTIPVARVFPCVYIDEYMKQVNPYMVDLCEGIGMMEGVLFIQGLYDSKNNRFNIFEAGLRSAGEAPHRFLKHITGLNVMHLLTDHVMGVVPEYDIAEEDPYLNGKCCGIISFVAKGGVVGSITGLEEAVAATPSVVEYENRYPVGSVTPDGDTLRQLMIRFVMICENRDQMAADIAYLNEHITVLNEHGENMVVKIEPSRVFSIK